MVSGSRGNDRRIIWAVCAAAVLTGAAVLYFFDPAQSGFYPVCLLHRTTGLLCPGCGGLRAVHQILHGDLAAAFQLNALFVLCLPALAFWGAWLVWQRIRGKSVALRIRPVWVWVGVGVLLAFAVARNL